MWRTHSCVPCPHSCGHLGGVKLTGDSHLSRHDIRVPIIPRKQRVRFIIRNEPACGLCHAKRTSHAVADVSQVAQCRRADANLDVGVQQLVVAGAYGFEEVLHVHGRDLETTFLRLLLGDLLVLLGVARTCAARRLAADVAGGALVNLEAGSVDGHEPAVPEKDVAYVVRSTESGEALGRRGKVARVESDLGIPEVKRGLERVGCLLIVLPYVLAACGGNRNRPASAVQTPGADIHLVHALIADISVARIPEPVPVVSEFIFAVRLPLRGAEKTVPIKSRGNRFIGRVADGETAPEAEA